MTLPGSVLPGPFPIAARKTYGHVSDGMIASARELGLGDEHDGILRLADLGLDPDRRQRMPSRCSASTTPPSRSTSPPTAATRSPSAASPASTPTPRAPPSATRRTPSRLGTGRGLLRRPSTTTRPSAAASAPRLRHPRRPRRRPDRPTPAWMIARLKLAGIRSISLVVDITNYVMLELGQPMHGYDLDTRRGGIVVRRAHAGENITTLDDAGAHARRRRPAHHRRAGARRSRRRHGRRPHRDRQRHRRAHRGRELRPGLDRPHRPPPQAAERGIQALRARRRPARRRGRSARVVQLLDELAGGTADALGSTLLDTAQRPASPIACPGSSRADRRRVHRRRDRRSLLEIGAPVEQGDGGARRHAAELAPRPHDDTTSPRRSRASSATTASRPCFPSRLPAAASPATSVAARRRGPSRPTARPRSSAPFVSGATLRRRTRASRARAARPSAREPARRRAAAPCAPALPGLAEIARRNLSRGLTDLAIFETSARLPARRPTPARHRPTARRRAHPDRRRARRARRGLPRSRGTSRRSSSGNAIAKQPGRRPSPWDIADALGVARDRRRGPLESSSRRAGDRTRRSTPDAPRARSAARPFGFAGELLPALAAARTCRAWWQSSSSTSTR